ncbi:MAG TPA: hypothetical protein VIP05_10050 [Burkholderiaceae bacterium]
MSFSAAAWLACSAVVGAAQVVDAWANMKRRSPRVERLTHAFAFFEFVWAGVTFMVWRRALPGLPAWLPVSFMAYVAAMGAAGIVVGLLLDEHQDEHDAPKDVIVAGGLFGVFFALACARYWLALP